MKGTRPLDNNEILLVSACFDGTFEARNRGLFLLGVSTGDVSVSCSAYRSRTFGRMTGQFVEKRGR